MIIKKQLFLIPGVVDLGKSTVAEAFAGRFNRAVHPRGDVFRRMIVIGYSEIIENPSDEALPQLGLCYILAVDATKAYYAAGFIVMHQDRYYDKWLPFMVSRLRPPMPGVMVPCPDAETGRAWMACCGKTGYTGFKVEALYQSFMDNTTPHIGF